MKRPSLGAVPALALAFSLASSLAFSSTQPAQAEPAKFDIWYGFSGDLSKRMQEVCDAFNRSQSDSQAVCTSQGDYATTLQNTIAAFRAKKQPTVVQVFDVGTLDMMLSGAFLPANKLMEENGYKIDYSDYFPGIARYYATSKGEMFSFPFNSSTALLYVNKDALAKIGKTAAPATWEEAHDDMVAMQTSGFACPMAINVSPNESWQLLEQFSAIHNQPIATRSNGYEGLDAKLEFNKTLFVKFITDLKSWFDAGLVKIKSKENGQDMVQAFASGDCQMIMTSVGDHGTVTATVKSGVNWGVAPLPVYAGSKRMNSLVGGASLWVLAGKSPEEYKGAAAFLAYIAKPEQVQNWSTVTGYIPVTKSGFETMTKAGFFKDPKFAGREVAIESLTASEPNAITRGIRLGGFPQIRTEVGNALQAIFANKLTVQAGIDEAVQRGDVILRRFEATYSGKTIP